jgi:hypothetical protein
MSEKRLHPHILSPARRMRVKLIDYDGAIAFDRQASKDISSLRDGDDFLGLSVFYKYSVPTGTAKAGSRDCRFQRGSVDNQKEWLISSWNP